jgi:Kdo2-lipid IVA lauroyltransferase/acyltransferase
LDTFFTKLSLSLLSLLPLSAHHHLGKLMGWLLLVFKNRNKHIAQVNIDICFPELSNTEKQQLLKKTLQENGKTLIECFWLWRHPRKVLGLLLGNIKNHQLLKRAATQGTIFVTPHFGSWEFIGLLTAAHSDLLILYAPPKSAHIATLSCLGRSSTGGTVISQRLNQAY